tara:strand:- start:186 stop:683 length:498 start_codon:yes stop_codon:yes gene_type:complete
MSEETKVATETVSEETTQETPTNTPDVGSLIAESKKYRQRSQDAEAQVAKLKTMIEEQEKAKMVEKEEWKTLYENEKGYKDKYNTLVDQRKSELLKKLPTDQHEKFKDKDLDVLEFMVSSLSQNVAKETPARGAISTPKSEKTYAEMTDLERRRWHQEMMSNQKT